MPILSVSGMHLKQRSRGSSLGRSSGIKGTAGAVSGTGLDNEASVYSMKSGTLLTFGFLFLVGWVPMVGQAIAGFVGGRRSGSPYRSLVTSAVAMVMALAVVISVAIGIQTACSIMATTPERQIAAFSAEYPLLGQLASGLLAYFYALLGTNGTFEVNLLMYLVVIPFGVLGGVVAGQTQKEMRMVSYRTAYQSQRTFRSLDCYNRGKKMGFESYEEYSAMSVNSMTTAAHKPEADVSYAQTRETPIVSSTVDINRIASAVPTSTMASSEKPIASGSVYNADSPFVNILHVSTHRPTQTETKKDNSSDRMDFI